MSLKGQIQPDHIPNNKFEFNIIGLPPITVTAISGLENEVPGVELPDRTMASGGQRSTSEATIKVPNHHTVDIAAMELWYEEGVDPVSPTYKKAGTLVQISGTGAVRRSWALTGVWVKSRSLMDMEMADDGEMSENEYTLSIDDITPI